MHGISFILFIANLSKSQRHSTFIVYRTDIIISLWTSWADHLSPGWSFLLCRDCIVGVSMSHITVHRLGLAKIYCTFRYLPLWSKIKINLKTFFTRLYQFYASFVVTVMLQKERLNSFIFNPLIDIDHFKQANRVITLLLKSSSSDFQALLDEQVKYFSQILSCSTEPRHEISNNLVFWQV